MVHVPKSPLIFNNHWYSLLAAFALISHFGMILKCLFQISSSECKQWSNSFLLVDLYSQDLEMKALRTQTHSIYQSSNSDNSSKLLLVHLTIDLKWKKREIITWKISQSWMKSNWFLLLNSNLVLLPSICSKTYWMYSS